MCTIKHLKFETDKDQVKHKGKHIKITPDFLTETLKARRILIDVGKLKHHRCCPDCMPSKTISQNQQKKKSMHNKTKFKDFLSTKKIFTEDTRRKKISLKKKVNYTKNTQRIINHRTVNQKQMNTHNTTTKYQESINTD